MWGNTNSVRYESLHAVRIMYASTAGHEIIYNAGKKDLFQVCVVENGLAFPMHDVDYFSVVKSYYTGENRGHIIAMLKWFAAKIDSDSGDAYATFGKNHHASSKTYFDVHQGTFGYQTSMIKDNLQIFKQKYLGAKIDDDGRLEEAMVIIYLAMISEWYYGLNNSGIDTGKRSVWQHRMKLLGLAQVLSDEMTPEDAAEWSRGKNSKEIAKELHKFSIYDRQCQLLTPNDGLNGHHKKVTY